MEDLNPIGPEGDGHYRPLNMTLVGDTENEKEGGADTKQIEPAPDPVEPDGDDEDDDDDNEDDAGTKNLAPDSRDMAPEKSNKKRAQKKTAKKKTKSKLSV